MLRLAGLALLATTLLVPTPGAAQAEEGVPSLELLPPSMFANGTVPIAPAEGLLHVPWTFKFPTPASSAAASSGETSIEWSLQCAGDVVTLRASPTVVPVEAAQTTYEGIAILNVSASANAPGLKSMQCTMQGTATAPGWPQPITGTADFAPRAAFVGEIRIDAPMPSRKAGPDKQIPFEITVENLGNSRVVVNFQLEAYPSGRWDVLVPDPVVLDSRYSGGEGKYVGTVYATVSTSYHNGPNKDAKDIVLIATTHSADDPDVAGPTSRVTLHSDVEGWYIPGPSPALLLVALALAGLVVRRRS